MIAIVSNKTTTMVHVHVNIVHSLGSLPEKHFTTLRKSIITIMHSHKKRTQALNTYVIENMFQIR
jgi:hypothetical protein